MLYRILVLSVGLLGSTAIGSAFAGKNGTSFVPEEKGQRQGQVSARVAALNKNEAGRKISPKPQTGRLQAQQPLQRPSPTIIRPQQNKQPQFVGGPRQPEKGIPPQVAARTAQRPLPTSPVKAFIPQPTLSQRQQFIPPKTSVVANSQQLRDKGKEKEKETNPKLPLRRLPTPLVKNATVQHTIPLNKQYLPTQTRQVGGEENAPLRRALPITLKNSHQGSDCLTLAASSSRSRCG